MDAAAQTIRYAKMSGCSTSVRPIFQYSKAFLVPHNPIPFGSQKKLFKSVRIEGRKQRNVGVIPAAESETTSTTGVVDRWLLEPIGDGDSRHIGLKLKMPDAFVIASSEVTVGRLPEKADMVIPVATVSGVHARIQKKGGNLLITDLDSTNGTFIGDKRLKPGVVATLSSGTSVTFGDTHLAMFRVSKLEDEEEAASEPELASDEGKGKTETDSQANSSETSG